MSLTARFRSWLRSMTSRSKLERDMDAELAFHIESYIEDLELQGIPHDEATRRARIEFGGIATHKDGMRASLGLRLWDDLWADLRYALRMMRRSPGFTAIAVGSLALGIGANTAIFTLTKQVLFDKLSVQQPDQLLLFQWTAPSNNIVHHSSGDKKSIGGGMDFGSSFPYPLYQQLRRENHVLEDLFAFRDANRLTAIVGDEAISATAQMVSGNFYSVLGVHPILGRALTPADDAGPDSAAVTVISNAFWTQYFGRSPNAIGRSVTLDGKQLTIVGVNPPSFTGAADAHLSPDLFIPFSLEPVLASDQRSSALADPEFWWVQIMGRHNGSASVTQAQAELDLILQAMERPEVDPAKHEAIPHLELANGSQGLNANGRELNGMVYVLSTLAGLVLLMACTNIANLMLARSTAREREISVRMALGASRERILRQVLTESVLLACIGGVAGLALAWLGRNVLPGLLTSSWQPPIFNGHLDGRIFAFTAAMSILTGLVFGVAPAWKSMRTDADTGLKDRVQTAGHFRRGFAGRAIVVFQVALSTLLVVGALLFLRTLHKLDSTDPGFRTDHLLLFRLQVPKISYPGPKDVALFHRIEEEIAALPGVESVALSDNALIARQTSADDFIRLDKPYEEKADHEAWTNSVSQNFFATMGIPILEGREFNASDTETSPKVAIINRALARKYFPDGNPIGKTFRGYYFVDQEPFQIVGISADTRYHDLRRPPPPTYYVLYRQLPHAGRWMMFEVRTHIQPASLVPALQHAVRSVDPNLPLMDIRTQAEQIGDTIQQERLLASLAAGFGVLALSLASIGIYGIMAYSVTRRTSEIGIRRALGAQTGQVLGIVLGEASGLAVTGIALGIGVALMFTHLLGALLFEIRPNDPLTMISSALLLLAIALLAGFFPARRAARIEPMQALRHQ
ncbi:ADOP family duplicated permease [Silvibacterium acidisoli]|uniref:ADOP family duplicated permease n=1 Tax=Acidobacteriaceae bacterium ZG23-2 TaxID=2883246 RepID=UPI00406CF272